MNSKTIHTTCPVCNNELTRIDLGELSFSHSEDINGRGDTVDCWYTSWQCNCGVIAQEWWEDDPSTDYGKGVLRTGEWSYWNGGYDELIAYRNRKGELIKDVQS